MRTRLVLPGGLFNIIQLLHEGTGGSQIRPERPYAASLSDLKNDYTECSRQGHLFISFLLQFKYKLSLTVATETNLAVPRVVRAQK